MGIGRILKTAAPIAAGYFTGGAGTSLFGLGATGSAIAAGALTGAGIAALSGEDALMGGITGGLGGMSGGAMGTAAQATKLSEAAKLAQAGAPTGSINSAMYGTSPFTPAGAGAGQTMNASLTGLKSGAGNAFIPNEALAMNTGAGTIGPKQLAPSIQAGQGPNMGFRSLSTDVAGGGGYQSIGDTFAQGIGNAQAAFNEPGEFLKNLGGGSKAMGAGKLGITGLGIAGGAGAFDVEPVDIGPREEEKYDPTRRLNLGMDTGISQALKKDTGLRLLAQGGEVKKYVMGGPLSGQQPAPPPKYGIIDVGGKFVETSKEPGPGLISDSDYKEQYGQTTAQQNQQGGGGGGMDPNLAPGGQGGQDGSLNPGAISALASGFAQQQMNPPTKSQTLGLEALAGGGRVKGYANGGYATLLEAAQAMDKMYPKSTTDSKGRTHYSNIGSALLAFADMHGANIGQPSADTSSYDYALNLNTGKQEALAGGGYLETGGEVGDGMSDEIEATIEGTQEARLSDGEFVVPADVVSHLGNGSSDAGAKRLYEMMDKIRMARTGTKKQGKEINPERYMPA